MTKLNRPALSVALALLLGGCASIGANQGVLTRKVTWFSYLNADDIRETCKPGSSERIRMVYNADYDQHVRTYDLSVDDKTGAANLTIRVMQAAKLSDFSFSDLLAPWRGIHKDVALTPKQSTRLQGRITRSGAFEPPQAGLSLSSDSFYWLVSGCHEGRGFLNAFPISGADTPTPDFVPMLQEFDKTGVQFPDIAEHNRRLSRMPPRHPQDISTVFTLRVSETGLSGTLPP